MTRDSSESASESFGLLVDRSRAFLENAGVVFTGKEVVVGCSGGVDSTVLLSVLLALRANPFVVHVNYGLRGDESDLDEALVRDMCARWNLRLRVHLVPPGLLDTQAGRSLQEIARDIRYRQFGIAADEVGANVVVLGHTLDDQAETSFMHILRGTGIDGVGGMPPVRRLSDDRATLVVRPFLSSSRDEIERIARMRGLAWREDATNLSETYVRGRVRTIVVPAIDAAFGEGRWLNFGRTANVVGEYVRAEHGDTLEELFALASGGLGHQLLVDVMESQPRVWRRRLLLEAVRRWCPDMPRTAGQVVSVESLLSSQVGKYVQHGAARITRDRNVLLFHEVSGNSQPTEVPLPIGGSATIGSRCIHLYEIARPPLSEVSGAREVVYVDADLLTTPLTVRFWRPGDRFRPLGLEGTKLVSDLLTDRKIRAHGRKEVALVLSGDRIVWCAGVEIASEFRLTHRTRRTALLFSTYSRRGNLL